MGNNLCEFKAMGMNNRQKLENAYEKAAEEIERHTRAEGDVLV
jgi:hypothetical protein